MTTRDFISSAMTDPFQTKQEVNIKGSSASQCFRIFLSPISKKSGFVFSYGTMEIQVSKVKQKNAADFFITQT